MPLLLTCARGHQWECAFAPEPGTSPACPVCGEVGVLDAPTDTLPPSDARGPVPASEVPTLAPVRPAAPMAPPEVIPGYELIEELGRGGMGVVFKARHERLDRLVAIKVLPPEFGREAAFAERFTREARALARLNHPHIVSIYDFGQADGQSYFIMEFVEGGNLRQRLKGGRIPQGEALAIALQVCEALQFAHEEGIVHRDIKPENVLLDRKGRVKIADFGLARLLTGPRAEYTLTGPWQAMGTLHYAAPEQMMNALSLDHRADIYSLGVLLYEMLTGRLPVGRFPSPSQTSGIDPRLDELILRMLEQEPDRRPQRVAEVRAGLEAVTQGRVMAIPVGVPSPPPASVAPTAVIAPAAAESKPGGPPRTRNVIIVGGIAFVTLAILLIGLSGAPVDALLLLTVLGMVTAAGVVLVRAVSRSHMRREQEEARLRAALDAVARGLSPLPDKQGIRTSLPAPVPHLATEPLNRPSAPDFIQEQGPSAPAPIHERVLGRLRRASNFLILGGLIDLGLVWAPTPRRAEVAAWYYFHIAVPLVGVLLVLGAIRLRQARSLGLSRWTTRLSMLPLTPAWPVSLLSGFWAWLMLRRPEVRAAFEARAAQDARLPWHHALAPSATWTAGLILTAYLSLSWAWAALRVRDVQARWHTIHDFPGYEQWLSLLGLVLAVGLGALTLSATFRTLPTQLRALILLVPGGLLFLATLAFLLRPGSMLPAAGERLSEQRAVLEGQTMFGGHFVCEAQLSGVGFIDRVGAHIGVPHEDREREHVEFARFQGPLYPVVLSRLQIIPREGAYLGALLALGLLTLGAGQLASGDVGRFLAERGFDRTSTTR